MTQVEMKIVVRSAGDADFRISGFAFSSAMSGSQYLDCASRTVSSPGHRIRAPADLGGIQGGAFAGSFHDLPRH
ncbi:hypothetical protein [Telmatospirillum sp.]|uniref:hypothetical protein n=1 Tax=Telmatospirillum sp. TaxID=2079197 RepID=UPI00284A4C0A|nr:hypothetical protein [Telmatospirillum sp.]MDR3435286.1 hypothetical protein [Telmatospirillum sp.]